MNLWAVTWQTFILTDLSLKMIENLSSGKKAWPLLTPRVAVVVFPIRVSFYRTAIQKWGKELISHPKKRTNFIYWSTREKKSTKHSLNHPKKVIIIFNFLTETLNQVVSNYMCFSSVAFNILEEALKSHGRKSYTPFLQSSFLKASEENEKYKHA